MTTYTLTIDISIPRATGLEMQIIKGMIRTHELLLYTRAGIPIEGSSNRNMVETIGRQLHAFINASFGQEMALVIGISESDADT